MAHTTNFISPIVELAGPAGAGKTTLLRALKHRYPQMQADLPVSKAMGFPIYFRNTLSLGPAYLRSYRDSRWFSTGERRSMIYLKAWHNLIVNRRPKDRQAILLDHGPIYRLATLREFGPPFTQSSQFAEWWNRSFEEWATTLDLVISLDAPDAILIQRIHDRAQEHVMQGKPYVNVSEFLTRYRLAIAHVTEKLCSGYGVSVVNVDTAEMGVDTIVDRVQTILQSGSKDGPEIHHDEMVQRTENSVNLRQAKA